MRAEEYFKKYLGHVDILASLPCKEGLIIFYHGGGSGTLLVGVILQALPSAEGEPRWMSAYVRRDGGLHLWTTRGPQDLLCDETLKSIRETAATLAGFADVKFHNE